MCLPQNPWISFSHFCIFFLWTKKKNTNRPQAAHQSHKTLHTHTHARLRTHKMLLNPHNQISQTTSAKHSQQARNNIALGKFIRLAHLAASLCSRVLALLLSNGPKSARSTLNPTVLFVVHVNHKSPTAPYDTSGSASAHYDIGTLQLHNR